MQNGRDSTPWTLTLLRTLDITAVGYSKIETVDQNYEIPDSVPTGRDAVRV